MRRERCREADRALLEDLHRARQEDDALGDILRERLAESKSNEISAWMFGPSEAGRGGSDGR